MVTSVNSAKLVTNSSWNFIAFSIAVIINFVTIPIVISYIGIDEFGISGIIIAIYAPFMLLGVVLSQIIVQEFSQGKWVSADGNGVTLYTAALCVCVLGCILVVMILTVAAEPIISLIIKKTDDVNIDWHMGFLIAGIGWAAQQGIFIFQATIVSTQRYSYLAGASIFTSVLSAVALVMCVWIIPNFLGFLIGTSLGLVISLISWIFLVRYLLPELVFLSSFCKQDLSRIVRLGRLQSVAQLVGSISNQIDRYVLGIMAPIAVVGQYNIAMRLQEVIHMGLLKITEVVFPHFSSTLNDPIEQRAHFYLQASWIISLIGLAILTPLITLSNELITIWLGTELAHYGGKILRTLAVSGIFGICSTVYIYFSLGTKQNARVANLSMAHALLTVIFTIILIGRFGPLAAGVGYLIANVFRLAITLWFASQYFLSAMSLRTLLLCILPPLAGGFIISWYWFYTNWFQPEGWMMLLIDYAIISSSVFIGTLLATSFSKEGRQLMEDTIFSLRYYFREYKACVE